MPDPKPGYDPRHPHNNLPPRGQIDRKSDFVPVMIFILLIVGVIGVTFSSMLASGFNFNIVDDKLISISKPGQCENKELTAGEYTHHDGFSVDIPIAGVYEICTEPFLWRAE